jgi:hypothetical protein
MQQDLMFGRCPTHGISFPTGAACPACLGFVPPPESLEGRVAELRRAWLEFAEQAGIDRLALWLASRLAGAQAFLRVASQAIGIKRLSSRARSSARLCGLQELQPLPKADPTILTGSGSSAGSEPRSDESAPDRAAARVDVLIDRRSTPLGLQAGRHNRGWPVTSGVEPC